VLCCQAWEGGRGLVPRVLALGIEGMSEVMEEHVFFWVRGNGRGGQVGGAVGRD
jgi:hypothetical protein